MNDGSEPLGNARYEKFAQARVRGLSASDAYKGAGYSAADSNSKGSRMAAIDSIKKRIAWLQKQSARDTMLTAAEKREICAKIARSGGKDSDRLKAIEVDNDLGGDGAEAAMNITIRRAWLK